jgi:hypothetical protein
MDGSAFLCVFRRMDTLVLIVTAGFILVALLYFCVGDVRNN